MTFAWMVSQCTNWRRQSGLHASHQIQFCLTQFLCVSIFVIVAAVDIYRWIRINYRFAILAKRSSHPEGAAEFSPYFFFVRSLAMTKKHSHRTPTEDIAKDERTKTHYLTDFYLFVFFFSLFSLLFSSSLLHHSSWHAVNGKFYYPSGKIECNEPIEVVSYKIGVCKVSAKGKDCKTTFQKLGFNGKTSVVLCKPKTGRMHQIRVHLQFLGKWYNFFLSLALLCLPHSHFGLSACINECKKISVESRKQTPMR